MKMKKKNFYTLLLGIISGLCFAVGMCMALLPEWNAFVEGIAFGVIGLVLGAVTVALWRKMSGKSPIRPSAKGLLTAAVGVAGALLLGVGMCLVMVWQQTVAGILIGIVGIAVLLALIPLTVGLRD